MEIERFIDEKLEYINYRIDKSKAELDTYPNDRFWLENRKGEIYYFKASEVDGLRKRILINRKPEEIGIFARRDYLNREIALLNNNAATLRKVQKIIAEGYFEPSVNNVMEAMKDTRRIDAYLNYFEKRIQEFDARLEIPIESSRYPRDVLEWATAPYERSTYKPEELKHRTSQGLMVRSKSEVVIIERVYSNKVPFRYEEVVRKGGMTRSPDLIIPDINGKYY